MDKSQKTYWPHMIVGFLLIGIFLGYWTVKSASSLPVQKSNDYMMKYQDADISINEIVEREERFYSNYNIESMQKDKMVMVDNINSNLPQLNAIVLKKGKNSFFYKVTTKDGKVIDNANVAFLLTRPHSTKDDNYIYNVNFKNGFYAIENIEIKNAGRYTLQLRVTIDKERVGYLKEPAYLKP